MMVTTVNTSAWDPFGNLLLGFWDGKLFPIGVIDRMNEDKSSQCLFDNLSEKEVE